METSDKKHRKDIDGLRSIAVILVILNHAGFSTFSGGFVGVDVFFVISGFLITGIIYRGVLTQTFSFSDFYLRRIKRLMPALFAMILVTTLASLFYLYPSDLMKYSRSLLWVLAYVGNFFYWLEHGGYFEGNTQEAPLLHTWSLAVEEQYYLLWPFYLILGMRLLGTRVFGWVTLGLFFACVAVSELALDYTIGAAYYLLPTRMFELMLGSILAMYWNSLPRLPAILTHVLSIAGIALITYSGLTLNDTSPFPGINALYPVVGAALIILCNREHQGIVNKLLSLPPFVFIGAISYSLYLWHWPILVFVRYQAIEMTFPVQTACIAAAILMAWLSWKYVETPVRRSELSQLWPVAQRWVLAPALITVSVSALILAGQGLPLRFPNSVNVMDRAYNSLSQEIRSGCHASVREATNAPADTCLLGTSNSEALIVGMLIGDSHANHLAGFVNTIASDAGVRIQDYSLDQCPPIFDIAWGRNASTAQACHDRNDIIRGYLKERQFQYVFLGSSWPASGASRLFQDGSRLTDNVIIAEQLESAFLATLEVIISTGAIPVVFDDVPFLGTTDPKCSIKREAFNGELACDVNKTTNSFFEAVVDRARLVHPQLIRVTLADYFCQQETCLPELDGVPLYSDNDHLNYLGSAYLGELFLGRAQNPLKRVPELLEN